MSLQAVVSTESIIFLVREERPQDCGTFSYLVTKCKGSKSYDPLIGSPFGRQRP